jgi:AbrB family looped-hinge helix DNA binding protein
LTTRRFFATELHIALDENFLPIEHPGDDGQIAVYEGTLDLVMLHSRT